MKTMKNFTDGLAVLLAVLILIYALTLYAKFNPNEKKLENGESKLIQFINNASTNRDHLRLVFVMTLTALSGYLFRKRPEISGAFSLFAVCFVLTLSENKQLVKYPNVIIILILGNLVGNIAYCAEFDLENQTNRCTGLSIIGSIGALTVSGICNIYQSILSKTAELVEEMVKKGVDIPDKLRFIPDAINVIYRHFTESGVGDATDVMYQLEVQLSYEPMRDKFLDDIAADQYTVYLKLLILLFGAMILTVGFSKKFRFIAAITSIAPFVYEFVMLQNEKLSCMSLSIMACTLFAFIMNVVRVSITGQRPISVEEAEEYAENVSQSPAGEDGDDEIMYT